MNSSQNFSAVSLHLSVTTACYPGSKCTSISKSTSAPRVTEHFSVWSCLPSLSPPKCVSRKKGRPGKVCFWRVIPNQILLTKDCVIQKKSHKYILRLPSVDKMYHCTYILTTHRILTQRQISHETVSKQQINKLCLLNKCRCIANSE